MEIIIKAISFGFLVAMPIGPIGLLCISRTMASGFSAGLATGVGVALADGLYAAIVALGAAAFAALLSAYSAPLQIAGGLLLALLGLNAILRAAHQASVANAPTRGALLAAGASAFALTMANPSTIATFAAIATGVGVKTIAPDYSTALLFAIGLALGSFLWWALLSGGVALARHRLPAAVIAALNRISGGILIAAGLYLAGLGAGLF